MAQGSTNVALSPWNVVALDTFQTPERTQASQWRRSWRAATTWMIGKEASERQAKQESELRALPKVKLAHVAPPIDWLPATERLKQALKSNLAKRKAQAKAKAGEPGETVPQPAKKE